MSATPTLEIQNLEVAVDGKPILKGLTLAVRKGEIHALMGPNGSGKSTLANALMGNPKYEITAGKILYKGEDLADLSADERARKGLFLAFQYPTAIPGVSVANFLRTALNVRRKELGDEKPLPMKEFRALVKEKMALLKMDESFAGRYLNDGFSGGEKKRAEILQLAVLRPEIAVLDETDSGLDIDALRIVSEGVNAVAGPDLGVLLITHYQRILNYIKPHFVHVLVDGRIVKSGGPELALELEAQGYDKVREDQAAQGRRWGSEIEAMIQPNLDIREGYKEKYGFHDEEKSVFKTRRGLDRDVMSQISEIKSEPAWMKEFRLKSLEHFERKPLPRWGGKVEEIDFQNIYYYLKPAEEQGRSWDEVPADIKKTFDRLGIPEAEQKFLSGVGAQYDSETVYHRIKEELSSKGVIFLDTGTALKEHPDLFREYFGTIIPPSDNKFAALNSAVWSGGSFIYVPKGVKVDLPLQAYFRINAKDMGQFERTLIIVDEGASVHYVEGCTAPIYASDSLHSAVVEIIVKRDATCRYTTIQNWSNNVYNLVTKRAVAQANARMEWVDANLGSKLTMKYPSVYLTEPGAHAEILSIAFAGKGQHQDAGGKAVHAAPHTTSSIVSKSISKDGGRAGYRGLIKVAKGAKGCKSTVRCDALLLDEQSRSDTYPYMEIEEDQVSIGHEATVSKIGDEQIFYLMSRGIPEAEASAMIVNGFIEPITKELPMEYAVEMNRLIQLQMEGSVG